MLSAAGMSPSQIESPQSWSSTPEPVIGSFSHTIHIINLFTLLQCSFPPLKVRGAIDTNTWRSGSLNDPFIFRVVASRLPSLYDAGGLRDCPYGLVSSHRHGCFLRVVEQALDPTLQGKPVIVGGRNGRGVVTSASYEARKFGVHSAMPGFQARKLCPQGIFLPNRRRVYSEFSDKVFGILEQYSPEVHAISIDEGIVDLTGTEDFSVSR